MNPRNWRIVAAVLGGIVALLGGIAVAAVILPGGIGATPAPAAHEVANGAAFPSVIGGPAGPGSPFAGGSASPSTAASASASTAPPQASAASSPGASGNSPSAGSSPASQSDPGSEPTATLTFVDLKLDAKRDPKGMTRTISFSTDGPGTIQAQFITRAPQGTALMCLTSGTALRVCKEIANGTVVAKAISGHNTWMVTLRGAGVFTPIADVLLTFPARNPSVTIAHARLDGKVLENYNGITVRVAPRGDGNIHLLATWPARDLVYDIGLVNEANGAANVTLSNQGPAMQTDQTLAVAGGAAWRLKLRSPTAGLRGTDLTATISWP
jgi:hypothetical protein